MMLSMTQKADLLQEIAANPNIPSPPTVVLRVLDQASKPDCKINDLCQIVQMDPGLSANILRTVNSAMFGLSRPATSVQRALAIVGLNSARLLVLALSFPRLQKSMKIDPVVKQRYWKSSIAGAIVARELSQRLHAIDSDDDMAACLLRDLGEMVLQQMFPEKYQTVLQCPEVELIHSQCELEEIHCGLDHAEVGAFILDRWRLPPDMTHAVRHHHHPERGVYTSRQAEDRAYLLHFATRAAQLLIFPDQLSIWRGLLELAQNRYGMDETAVREFLAPLGDKITEFAAFLQVDIGAANDYQAVLARANEELMTLTVAASLENQRAQEMARQAESHANHWKQEAAFDPLTKIFNRRFLETRLRDLLDRSKNTRSIGILFVDLDDFKAINDNCGHLVGDFVLQQVAECLNKQVRQGDIVARYGGDEFCVVIDGMEDRAMQSFAQRAWQKINAIEIRHGALLSNVHASVGAICCNAQSKWTTMQDLLAAADAAMYQAKTGGKNRVVFLNSLSANEQPQPAQV